MCYTRKDRDDLEKKEARRMYTIAGSGNAHLDIWVKSLERYQQSMDDFFNLYGGKPPHGDENEDD